jgi:hypothetical protein
MVIASLCVPYNGVDTFKVEHQQATMYSAVRLLDEGWEVAQMLYSDCAGCGPAKKWFETLCNGDICVSYARECDDPVHPTVCNYYVDDMLPITVTAKSEDVFRALVDALAVKTPKGGILFSALSQESKAPRHGPSLENRLRSPISKEGTK